jgi:hypothetical protein
MSDTPETDAAWVEQKDMVILCRKLERERDEARTIIEDAKRALKATDYEGILLAAMRVKEERDEAREALMKIEDLFIDGTDIYADRENMGLIARTALEEAK